jgi:hypothetical protein
MGAGLAGRAATDFFGSKFVILDAERCAFTDRYRCGGGGGDGETAGDADQVELTRFDAGFDLDPDSDLDRFKGTQGAMERTGKGYDFAADRTVGAPFRPASPMIDVTLSQDGRVSSILIGVAAPLSGASPRFDAVSTI